MASLNKQAEAPKRLARKQVIVRARITTARAAAAAAALLTGRHLLPR